MSDPAQQAAAAINAFHRGNWAGELGLVLTHASRDEVRGTLELQPRHLQPYGIVHGGVHTALVETVASVGAVLDAQARGKQAAVGLENTTSFVRAARGGTLHVVGTPITRGRRSQLWEVTIRNDDGQVIATGRVRLLVMDAEDEVGGRAMGAGDAQRTT